MSKLICDICGTAYPDTESCCPICGCYPNNADPAEFMDEADYMEETEQFADDTAEEQASYRQKKEIFDYDEVNSQYEDDAYGESDYDDEEEPDPEDEEGQTNTLVVIILTVVIALLLMAAGFIFFRYFMPNMGGEDQITEQTVQETQAASVQTTEMGIPCKELYIISRKSIELFEEGQNFLISAKANPEDTTDQIYFHSADESVATVTEDGKVTAVSEGETVITISCGVSVMECPVTVKYIEDTVPTETETVPEETQTDTEETEGTEESADETAAAEAETEAENESETTAPAQTDLKDVTLKLKKSDIRLAVYYEFKLLLDCPLEQNEVQWSSEHPHIATVDENGVVTAKQYGTTAIIATYGEQKVQCIVRCS